MLRRIIKRMLDKYGMIGLLLYVGDHAVKASKSKEDDKIWEQIKPYLEDLK
tara:strand:+ start:447 stop:599 length:153 start_codon:yes stop_codon:yes gene_type:complete